MNIPSVRDNPIMYIGLLVGFEQAVSGGTIHLSGMIPAAWIPAATAWATALAFIGNAFMTALAAPSMSKPPAQAVAKALTDPAVVGPLVKAINDDAARRQAE